MTLRRINPIRRILLVVLAPAIAIGIFWWNGKLELASRESVRAFVHESLSLAPTGKSVGRTEQFATDFLQKMLGAEGVDGSVIDVVEGDLLHVGATHGATVRLRDGRAILLSIDATGGNAAEYRIRVITEGS